ncbi:HNH endonuclease [Primorskyibacter marinus]|uniref:HNH endonuclease n=1 Tax=Primorskyibacter marinus TaxID=1977320 RepID=UPI000E305334|nr:HNH endonuclease [Primorskyibacter marinus]
MNAFLLRINGDTRCPGGINVPANQDDWASGVFSAKLIKSAASTRADGTKAGPPKVGDRVYIWVIESGTKTRGHGLTGIARVEDVSEASDSYLMATSGLELLKNPVSFDRAYTNAPSTKIIAAVKAYRPERIWSLSDTDTEVLEELIAVSGGFQKTDQEDPIGEAIERNLDDIEAELPRRKQSWIKPRPGQAEFRRQSLERHGGKCAFTGTGVEEVLEAAHVIPHTGAAEFERPENNLLLRRDIHALFDLFLLSIEPGTGTVLVSTQLNGSPYEDLQGKFVDHKLAASALRFHYKQFCETVST